MRRSIVFCLSFILAVTAGCGGGGGGGGSPPPPAPPPPPPPPVTIGGTVAGLVGTGLTLQNGTGTPLAIAANGAFQFPGTVANGTTYFVHVQTQPGTPTQFCSAPNGAGVATSNTAITVICNAGTPRYLYTTDFNANLLYGFAVDGAGMLASVGAASATGLFPLDPAVAPIGAFFASGAGGFVYVRNSSAGTVSAFSIDSATGALTAVPGSPFNITGLGNTIIQTVLSPTGRYIYFLDQSVGGNGQRRIFAYTIQANGALVAVAGSPFNAVAGTHRLMIDPLGRFLYGATSILGGSSQVTTYLVNVATGALSSVQTPANGTFGLARGVVHPSGRFLYVARDSQGAPGQPAPTIDAYAIDTAIGQLTGIGSVAAALNNQSNNPVMDPLGRFLYVSGPGGVMGFAINATTGALTAVPAPGGAVLVGANIGQGDIDPTGRFLYSPIRENPGEGIAAHAINQTTGQLTVIPGTPFPLGSPVAPNFVKADASGRWLFVATFGDSRLHSLTINPASGVLALIDSESAGLNATQFTQAGTQ